MKSFVYNNVLYTDRKCRCPSKYPYGGTFSDLLWILDKECPDVYRIDTCHFLNKPQYGYYVDDNPIYTLGNCPSNEELLIEIAKHSDIITQINPEIGREI